MINGLWKCGMAVAVVACPIDTQAQQMSAADAAAAFGARERILDVSISPDGSKVAMVVPGPKQASVVTVLDVAANTTKPINFADGNPMTLSGCGWVSNARLLCTLYGVANYRGPWLPYSRLIAMDADGGNVTSLSAMGRNQEYIQQGDGYVVDWRDGASNKVLLARTYVPSKSTLNTIGGMAEGLAVDLLDTETGKVEHVESADRLVGRYLGDGTGNIRIKGSDLAMRNNWQTRGETTFVYRAANSKNWQPFSVYNSVTDEGLYPISVDGENDVAYALKSTDGRDVLYRVALDGSMKTEVAFAHPQVDVDGVVRVGRRGRVVGATFATDMRQTHFFDAEYASLRDKLGRALPHLPMITIVDSSADEKKHLIFASSDTDAGHYYYFDAEKRNLFEIGAERPQLGGVKLAEQKAISYQASDGTSIPGYLTLPPGSSGKALPAIVMPHGGPAARDEWGFDWLAQFFANRGYAVLQPNYRGSAGFGDEWFQENGFRSWKTAVGDVNDAGRWLTSQGVADPAKLAIVGWSYGGYAALQSNVLDPGLFKAIVAIAPVTDLEMLRDEKVGYTNSRIARDYIGEGPQLIEGSPLRQVAKIKAPVLMFHGDKDINVSVAQARAMDRALTRARGESELIVYPGIDHQLRDSAVRTDMLSKSDAFLAKSFGN